MTESFPRLLVATEFSPNASGGGPAVVRQMLRNWPTEKLFWWSCSSDHEAQFGRAFNVQRVAVIPRRLYPHRRCRALKSWLMQHFWTPWATRHLRNTIEELRPEVVWVIPHCWAIPPLGQVLQNFGIGFHVSMHDYADNQGCIFRFGRRRSQKMSAIADQLYASATTRDAISDSMRTDLHSRTGRDGTVLHAGLEPNDFEYLENKGERTLGEIRIAYAGTIIVEKTFATFVDALNRVRNRISTPVSLEFFTGHSYRTREWFDPSWMRERGLMAEPALSEALKKFAWGFAPMSLSDDDPRYNRFSLPTKFVSYLAAGLPVITLGHPESSLVKMAQTYRVGPCLSSGEPETMQEELFSALSNRNPWAQFGSEIQRCGHAEFDAERMRKTLYECFATCSRRLRSRDRMRFSDQRASEVAI
ncbi:MAG: hypothetical protein WA183_12375 [Chthoniobacterales bacterium]